MTLEMVLVRETEQLFTGDQNYREKKKGFFRTQKNKIDSFSDKKIVDT